MGYKTVLVRNWELGVGIGLEQVCDIPSGVSLESLKLFEERAKSHFSLKKNSLWGAVQIEEGRIVPIAAFLKSTRNEIIVVIDGRENDPRDVSKKFGF